jgi:F0F1-type ATP synthase assembly protein I
MAATIGISARAVIVRLTIGSFSVAALLGVAALLSGGSFGRTEGRVLLTTLLVGVASVAVLCYLATAGTPFQATGIAGGGSVAVPVMTGLLLIWGDLGADPQDVAGRTFGVGTTVAATLAQACLLLVLGARARPVVRALLVGTLVLASVLAVSLSVVLVAQDDPPSAVLRGMGVVAILDVLGTVVVSALSRFGPQAGVVSLSIPAGVVGRIDAIRGERSRDDVVRDAIEGWLADHPGGDRPSAPDRRT